MGWYDLIRCGFCLFRWSSRPDETNARQEPLRRANSGPQCNPISRSSGSSVRCVGGLCRKDHWPSKSEGLVNWSVTTFVCLPTGQPTGQPNHSPLLSPPSQFAALVRGTKCALIFAQHHSATRQADQQQRVGNSTSEADMKGPHVRSLGATPMSPHKTRSKMCRITQTLHVCHICLH